MKKIILFFLTIVICNAVIAQQKNKPVFNSYTAVGIQIGQSDQSLIAETINGVKYGCWFAGAGVAYNSYRYRSVPVFFDGRYSFGKHKQFFINGDIGYNINTRAKYDEDMFYTDVKYKGGIYLNAGFGYLLQSSKKHSFYFQLDYGKKQVSKVVNDFIIIDFPPYGGGNNYYTYKYDIKTVDIKMGFKF
jgi:hypothetical protein